MPSIKKITLDMDDIYKLKKYRYLRTGNYVINISDIPVKKVRCFGEIKY